MPHPDQSAKTELSVERTLQRRTGTWDVVATVRESPQAAPVITTGIVAERRMIGPYLAEAMSTDPAASDPNEHRLAYLRYFPGHGRWQYVSLDARFPVGVLPAWSIADEANGHLELAYGRPGFDDLGTLVESRIVGARLTIIRDGEQHETVQQFWKDAAHPGSQWSAVRYDYVRRA